MAVSAQVVNGKVVTNYTKDTNLDANKKGNDSLDKDAFLKILVAEMQYQDPLEPSSNTEWVTQMASFSQIEGLQEVSNSISEQKAADLVGKRVIIAASDNVTGDVNYVTGIVQSTEKKDDGIYLSVEDNLYKLDKLYAVVDEDYYKQIMDDIEKEQET